jgi:large subunit ribosomal protein L10
MAITRQKKEIILANLEKEFKNSTSIAFTSYTGSTVAEVQKLRRLLRAAGVKMIVAKKTLIKLAAKNTGFKEIPDESLPGPVAVAFANADELAGLQVLYKFGKENEKVSLLGAYFDGEVLGKSQALALAQLPSKEVLLGQLVGLLASPMRGVAGAGYQVIAGFARVVDAIAQKKAKENA